MADAHRQRTGRTPNLKWRGATLTWPGLRAREDLFDALPEREPGGEVGHPVATRQDDRAATRAHHAGRLTAGRLNAALGFCDGAVANRLAAPGRGREPGAASAGVVAHVRAAPPWAPGDPLPDAPLRPPASASALAARGIGAVRMAWGGAAEAAGVASVAAALGPTTRVREVGMHPVGEKALRQLFPADGELPPLPPLAASPDAVALHGVSRDAVDAALRGDEAPEEEACCAFGSHWLEPVEVKSACPFAAAGRDARGRARFALFPRPPRDAVPPSIVPQIQLQALAMGARSGLVVLNAVGGANVFRVARDDKFLVAMLRDVVSPWYVAHVLNEEPVCPGGTHVAGGAVDELATAAERVAAAAEFVASIPPWAEADPEEAFLE